MSDIQQILKYKSQHPKAKFRDYQRHWFLRQLPVWFAWLVLIVAVSIAASLVIPF